VHLGVVCAVDTLNRRMIPGDLNPAGSVNVAKIGPKNLLILEDITGKRFTVNLNNKSPIILDMSDNPDGFGGG
jgi:hypothetical protein